MEKDERYFKSLARNLMFELSDKEAHDIKKEFDTLLKQLELLDNIDTDGVIPMVYPFEEDTYFIREDVVDNVISVSEALSNAGDVREGHIVVKKVVK